MTAPETFTGANKLMGLQSGDVDAHAHVFECSLPMIKSRRYTPNADARLPDLITNLSAHDLAGALLVQPSFLGSDNSYLTQTLAQAVTIAPQYQFRGVAVVEPDARRETLNDLDQNGIIGCRLNLVGQESKFEIAHWQSVLAMADQLDWHVEIHCHADALASIVDAVSPHIGKIVVDHFGLPSQANIDAQFRSPDWLKRSSAKQLFVKLSAPYRFLNPVESENFAQRCQPIVQQLTSQVGRESLMWGSDWPWTQFERSVNYQDTVNWKACWAASVAD